ncbi:MAG: carbon monoxide dehydrogenase subunit G [Dehalococcoidales bacterium]|nr:carbon monoxide dehydrogenase subunit G [Dehalococcoidales bacterium]
MKLEGGFKLKAPRQQVWDIVLEPGTLAACVPGAKKVEQIDEKTYECLIKQSVGPISVSLQFTVNITQMEEPRYVKAEGRGEALGKMGTFTMSLEVTLEEDGDEVEIAYVTDVNIVGKLATFGERIMRAKAKTVSEDFGKNLQKTLQESTSK